ncbi:MAG: sigma-70 family RNA polymerase sigma factor [Solirubrobacterales bacterium]|nr:sigma-70 family RNA polymerase sigma factor [Solirubrobacterales bacterium]
MPGPSDPTLGGKHEDEHLRRFVAARERGDAAAMRRHWGHLVEDVFDRMDGIVYATHKGRLDDEEHELAVQLALVKFWNNLMRTFAGASMGELVNATRTLARGICIDVQRRSIARHGRVVVGLDHGGDDDPETPWAEAAQAHRRHDDEQRGRDDLEFLAWALPQVRENRRAVLQRTLAGEPLDHIAAALGITHDNAYQLRSRGIKDLKKLKELFDA